VQSPVFLIFLVVVALIFFVIVPSRQRKSMAAKQQALRASMTPGTPVMTTSGLHATVVAVGEGTVDLEIAPGVVTTWLLPAVREITPTAKPDQVADVEGPAGLPGGGATRATGGIVDGDGDPTDPTR